MDKLSRTIAQVFIGFALMSCVAHRQVRFDVGVLPSVWKPVHRDGAKLVFHHPGGGSIYANSACNLSDSDAPLDVLTNHLLFEFQELNELSRTPIVLAGRAALHTIVDGKLDGVRVALDLLVLKIDGCSVDLQLVAGPGMLALRRADFETFVRGFVFQGGN